MSLDELIQAVQAYNPNADVALIRRAYQYAEEAHAGQKRNSGEPYITHPLNVAMILTELHMDDATICAALLHDVLEDTPITYEEMARDFGEEIATLVDGVTKLKQIQSKSKVDNRVDNYRKMVMAMANDIRVIIVKLADRLHNLRTLDYKTREKQIEKAKETIEIYAPIAHRLGISTIKWELEDLCLKYLDPDAYYEIAELIDRKRSDREAYITRIAKDLSEKLDELGLHYEITGRPKSLYSIYKKIHRQGKTFDQIFDLTAIRVLVDTVKDCYSVLGVVHTMWKPIPRRFKDYIAMPKPNLYQSLHTTVIGPQGETFEVQIRTYEMHQTAEYGIAAHWKYKEGLSKSSNFDEKLNWVRQLMEWQKTTTDSGEFLETLKGDYFSDEVYVFSPKGDVIELPKGSTPIDFAYRVHSDVGNHCVGAKVDGRMVPIDVPLENGNIVEVLTSKNSTGPSSDWLKIVKSSQAKQKIRQYFKHQKRAENIENGREMLERDIRKEGLRASEVLTEEWIDTVRERMKYPTADDLFAAIGYGSQGLNSVVQKFLALQREKTAAHAREAIHEVGLEESPMPSHTQRIGDRTVRIRGEDIGNLQVKFAQCCSPVPGDAIIGYITKGKGISIHRKNCTNIINNAAPERLIEVEWDQTEQTSFYAKLQVTSLNRKGYLANIAEAIAKMGFNLVGLTARPNHDHTFSTLATLEITDVDQIADVMRKLRQVPGTLDVFRVSQ
uniref:RelA/SpoT family protein n=1 Tax=Ndongobacter massiliensis TaxID=1871025 RepID=UPI000930534A|nr:bifunctional (p)ppGpp synthetase/guanosine-3',5'-bis(diphosphate) 3'-pyrophosphohydrolase [Ndongobacter massiliensis]